MDNDEGIDIDFEIAQHILETYELIPYITSQGDLGIHFMRLNGTSINTGQTVISEVEDLTEDVMAWDEAQTDPENRERYAMLLSEWQAVLRLAGAKVDAALEKLNR